MKYVRSTTTGAILPYNEVLARRPNIQVLTPAECDAHDGINKPKATKKKAVKKKVEKKVEKKVAKETPFNVSSNEADIDEVVAALAID